MILAFIHEREDQEAVIRGRTIRWFLRLSMNAKVKKRPSVTALFNFCVRP